MDTVTQGQRCDVKVIEHRPEAANVDDGCQMNKAIFIFAWFWRALALGGVALAIARRVLGTALTIMPKFP